MICPRCQGKRIIQGLPCPSCEGVGITSCCEGPVCDIILPELIEQEKAQRLLKVTLIIREPPGE